MSEKGWRLGFVAVLLPLPCPAEASRAAAITAGTGWSSSRKERLGLAPSCLGCYHRFGVSIKVAVSLLVFILLWLELLRVGAIGRVLLLPEPPPGLPLHGSVTSYLRVDVVTAKVSKAVVQAVGDFGMRRKGLCEAFGL
ncbi:uncharacterized protein DS421_18g620040 [Arachis hypogaea]|nr:uncharacterized protein DS421_18g620040 [Arachis hypogaea]